MLRDLRKIILKATAIARRGLSRDVESRKPVPRAGDFIGEPAVTAKIQICDNESRSCGIIGIEVEVLLCRLTSCGNN
jgi:hypothetical protein